MSDVLILAAVFLAIVIAVFAGLSSVNRAMQVRRNIDHVAQAQSLRKFDPDMAFTEDNADVAYFLEIQRRNQPNSLEMRLIRAGFFSRDALRSYALVRLLVAVAMFVATWFAVQRLSAAPSPVVALALSALVATASFIVSNIVLERVGNSRVVQFRRLFPDLLDLLIVCVDAGMSIEAALDRVAREFLRTKPSFGLQLAIVSLEVRAGRPLYEALGNLAARINVEEVRTMAVLFRQSQELGTSIIKTLRVYSKEMRQNRLIQAEEKANALPVKMLLPLAGFLFPISLLMVLVPVLIRIVNMFMTMKPG